MKTFNISDWLPTETLPAPPLSGLLSSGNEDIEDIISRIESGHIDITSNYADWRDIGFAFADTFGEKGRNYYHRVSRYYPSYSPEECNKQFDACLNSNGHGITMRTFYHLAKQNKLRNVSSAKLITNDELRMENYTKRQFSEANSDKLHESGNDHQVESELIVKEGGSGNENGLFNTPHLPEEIYANLPAILSECADLFQDAIEKDVFLIGAIAVLSGCFPNVEGIYFDEPHSPHLYAFITAPAGSGKGRMKWARYFGQTIHEHLGECTKEARQAYNLKIEQYNNLDRKERLKTEKPEEPQRKMFFIPANSSSSAFIQALADNNFSGVIFETEAETLSATFKQEWGNFSDVLRKAFHHESTSLFRRKDNEFIEIKNPHLAIALSGTPRQVQNMMPDVENGLFSRFLYYAFEDNSEFKNPFISHQQVDYIEYFKSQGKRIFELYQQLNGLERPISFRLTPEQGRLFTGQFDIMLKRSKLLLDNDFEANIKRLGLITFRISMILSILRKLEDGDISDTMICGDMDFSTALTIASTLEKHAIAVYKNLPNNELKGIKLKFFEALPSQFNRQTFLKTAEELGLKDKVAEKYIGQFKAKLLDHEHNLYTKITN